MSALLALALGVLAYLAIWWSEGEGRSYDAQMYDRMAKGLAVPRPYCFRWYLPAVSMGAGPAWWRIATGVCLVWAAAVMTLWVGGPWQAGLFAAALFVGLPGIFRVNVVLPRLTDAPAFLFALLAAVCAREGHWVSAIINSLLAGACKESAPIFAAAWTLNPLPLVGLLAVPWWRKGSAPTEEWLTRPWQKARETHRGLWGSWQVTLLPWGLALPLALLAAPLAGWRELGALVVSLGLGYAQLLRSQDRARLFQWAAPAVIVLAVQAVPVEWMALLAVVHVAGQMYKGV